MCAHLPDLVASRSSLLRATTMSPPPYKSRVSIPCIFPGENMKLVTKWKLLFLCSLFLTAGYVLLPVQLHAQVTTSEIEGIATDDKGNPAADIEIVARNQESGTFQIAYTGKKGEFHFHLLTPGRYQVIARHLNYDTMVMKDVHLQIGQTSKVSFKLTPKEVQVKEVVVEATAPLIDTKKSDLSVTVSAEQIQNLPLNSRNFLELAEIAPGAKISTGGRGPVTTGAENSRFISAFIDGGDFKNDDLGGVVGTSFGFTTNIVPEDAIREFQVITSLYKAEYSRASNGMINAITKSGGNEFHGSAFSLFRTTGLNARGPFETVTNPLTGTAKPDYNRQQYGLSVGGPIIMDQTHFFLAAERNTINNFTTVFTSGRQPTLDGTFKNPTAENLFLGKIDHQFAAGNTMEVRLLDVSTDNDPGNFGGTNAYNNGFNLSFRVMSLMADDKWVLGPNTVNELRLQYQRYRKVASPVSLDPQFVYQSSGIVTGWNSNQPQTEEQDKYQLRDDLAYTVPDMMGSHTFKGGVTLTRERFYSAAAFSSGGSFTFATDASPVPIRGAIGLGDPVTSAWNTTFGIYGQDDWSPIENLTFNLGLRWDFETNMINNNFVNPFGADSALNRFVPQNYIGRGSRPVDYGDIAPRLGAAWDIFEDRSLVLRGGFGVFYDRMIWNLPSNELQDGRYNIYTVTFGPTAPATTNRDTLASYIRRGIGGAPAPAVVLFPNSLPTVHTIQWTAGLSHQVSPSLALSLDYVHIKGLNEYTSYDINNFTNANTGARALTRQYGAIALITADGKSWYDALQFGITRPYQGDWQMQVSYTLSWAFNTFDDPFAGYELHSSIIRAPSLQDERHRVVVSGVVNLPFELQLGGIASIASPRPVAVVTGLDNNLDGTRLDDWPSSGRNSDRPDPNKLRNWYKNVDLRLTRYFDILGGTRLAVIAEAFNLFNWSNYLTFVTQMNALSRAGLPIYGTANSAYNPRQVQLGARVLF
jgi:hypothetical protein